MTRSTVRPGLQATADNGWVLQHRISAMRI